MMAADTEPAPQRLKPDRAMIATFTEMVLGYCEHFVPVRALAEKGGGDHMPHTPFMESDAELAGKLAVQAGWAADNGMALFVVPGTVLAAGEAKAEHIAQTQVVLVDLDHGDIGAKRDHLARHLGEPSLEVASGGITPEGQRKLHLYWRLSEPAEGDDITTVCRARHMIACKVGGDPSFRSPHQPIRVAGSVHAKSGTQRLVEILHCRTRDHDLGDLVEAVMAMPPLEGEVPSDLDFNNAGATSGAVTELFSHVVREGGVDGTTRFEALSRIIGYWIRRCREGHVTAAQAWAEIVDYNSARIDPPWEESRLRHEAEKIWKLDSANYGEDYLDADPGGGPPQGGGHSGGSSAPVQLTEDALAEAFTDQHSEDWRYVAAWGQWLNWSGTVWRKEDTLQAYDLSRQICRAAARKAASAKLKAKLSSASTIAAVERIARADRRHAETTEVWDRNPWALNTPAGIVDLQSGLLGSHDRPAYMTKITSASPQGDCPVWLEFLDTVTGGDVELQRYLQRMAGYCLTGVTTEHALFFLYGTGANGKSVFANTLTAITGDYATVAAMDMFMASHGDRHPTDMAGLRGARVVSAIETEQGSRWAESKLKALTGGDKITARFMRQDFFEFTFQTFEQAAREWHTVQKPRWKPVHADDVITSLERDIFPHLGTMPMGVIDKPLLLSVLKKIEARGSIETARRVKQRVAAIYRYVNAHGAGVENPANDINDALAPLPPSKRYPALLEVEAIRRMLGDIDRAGASPVTRLAGRFLALTAQRPGMVRHMEWGEISGVDWGNPSSDVSEALWTVSAEKIKQELHLRSDEAFDHKIPLAWQAVETLRAVRLLTGKAPFVFPNARTGTVAMTENAIG